MSGTRGLLNAEALAENNGILAERDLEEQLEEMIQDGAGEAVPPMDKATEGLHDRLPDFKDQITGERANNNGG
jgi:hypothetical protein